MNEHTLFGDVDERASFEALAADRPDIEDTTIDALMSSTSLISTAISIYYRC